MRREEILDLVHAMVELTRNYVKQVGRSRVEEDDDAIPSDFRPAADGPVLFPSLLHFAARRRSARSSGRAGDFCGLRGRLSLLCWAACCGAAGDRRRRSEEREAVGDVGTDGRRDGETDGGGCDVAHGDGTTSLTAKKKSANI